MIPFIDLAAQRHRLEPGLTAAMTRVLDHGGFIMGPEVAELERRLAQFTGSRHVLSCANGTDALVLALMAKGIGPGDAVVCPSFTFVATAEAAALLGATPVFADVDDHDFTLPAHALAPACAAARALGLKPKAVIAVDLFGQPADYPALTAAAAAEDLFLIADAAQSLGGSLNGRPIGALAPVTTTSFFPAKPLGCYGDGGAVFVDDPELLGMMRSLRVHGQGSDKYDNVRIGLNARLDTLQAAILLEKLSIFADEIQARQTVAARYSAALAHVAQVPHVRDGAVSAWAQYTLVVKDRARVAAVCKDVGIPTAVYYPIPLHQQTGYRHFPTVAGGCPVSERLSAQVISLPMHPYLDDATQDRVISAVRSAL